MQHIQATTSSSTFAILDESQLPADPVARRLRERYIAARFLQFPQPTHELKNTSNVMRWARQLLDDEQPRLAAELLQFALEEDRTQRPIWLCLIELAYLGNDQVIDTMGNKLLPNDPRFAHAVKPVILPDWSTPESELRDDLRQRKLHESLVNAMTFHLSR